MRTVTDHKSLGWIGAWPCAGAERVIARNVGNTVQVYGPGITATRFIGGVQPMPADMAIGTTTVTFSGVNAGSEIRVYMPDGTEAAGIETCAANQVLSWSVYAPGSPNNTVTVRIVNMAYKIKEFSFTSTVGTVSLPIQQEPDPWYSNPA